MEIHHVVIPTTVVCIIFGFIYACIRKTCEKIPVPQRIRPGAPVVTVPKQFESESKELVNIAEDCQEDSLPCPPPPYMSLPPEMVPQDAPSSDTLPETSNRDAPPPYATPDMPPQVAPPPYV